MTQHTQEKLCHCGRPLHYVNKKIQATVQAIIDAKGENITMTQLETGRRFFVPRHYIALHGIKASEIHQLGFREVTNDTDDVEN